jgi:myo-inositol-1(or 4)-monophosphatase
VEKFDRTFQDNLCQIVREAGRLLLVYFGKKHKFNHKEDGSFATEADLASEKYLIESLTKLLPISAVLAEESGHNGEHDKDYIWVIDPLDGTNNYSYSIPYFAVSVGLVYKNEPIIGVVYNPANDELFFAQKGKGAFLNEKKITVSDRENIYKTLVCLAIPCRNKGSLDFLDITKRVQAKICSSIRNFGAAALDMAYVSCGRIDVSILKNLNWWDVAAGIVLVREAGGVVCEFDKESIGPDFSTCIATNSLLVDKFKKLLI